MPHRMFTLLEANALLPELRPLAEQITQTAAALRDAQAQLAVLVRGHGEAALDGPGHPERARYWTLVTQARDAEDRLEHLLDEVRFRGVEVKDLDRGLLDFRSRRDGEVVYLCWQLGEPEVGWWHGLRTGFAGRQPLREVERRPPAGSP